VESRAGLEALGNGIISSLCHELKQIFLDRLAVEHSHNID